MKPLAFATAGVCRRVGALALVLLAAPCRAERPMAVDDAGTLGKGGYKVEAGWSEADRQRGWEAAAGFAPVGSLEFEINRAWARDSGESPSIRLDGSGVAVKWIPLQQASGLSAGLKLAYDRIGLHQRGNTSTPVHARAVSALATWRFEAGQVAHLNLGREWIRTHGDDAANGTWGAGLEQPLAPTLRLTLEVFGVAGERPGRQAGLRWTVEDGLKLSVAVGRNGGRPIANAGIALEF